jgi:hypothetical protein
MTIVLSAQRRNIARLTAEAIIEQRSDGCYDQTASRLRYLKHLRSPRAARSEADAAHVRAKAEMLQIRIMKRQRKLVCRVCSMGHKQTYAKCLCA